MSSLGSFEECTQKVSRKNCSSHHQKELLKNRPCSRENIFLPLSLLIFLHIFLAFCNTKAQHSFLITILNKKHILHENVQRHVCNEVKKESIPKVLRHFAIIILRNSVSLSNGNKINRHKTYFKGPKVNF